MKINIEDLNLRYMRFGMLGDYFDEDGARQIRVAKFEHEVFSRLIAIHELVEDTIRMALGISDKTVDDYCQSQMDKGIFPDSDTDKNSPIYNIHTFTNMIERMVCEKCGIDWVCYDNFVTKKWEENQKVMEYITRELSAGDKLSPISQGQKEQLLNLETTCFPESIQEDWDGIKEGIENSEVVIMAYHDSKIIGNIICAVGEPVDLNDPDYQENKEDWDSLNALYKYMLPENGIYVNSVAVLPEYQGKGLGQKLIQKAIESAKEKGFRAMYCHANEGESAHLFEKMGGQVISQRPNWFSTSHNYKVIRINLED